MLYTSAVHSPRSSLTGRRKLELRNFDWIFFIILMIQQQFINSWIIIYIFRDKWRKLTIIVTVFSVTSKVTLYKMLYYHLEFPSSKPSRISFDFARCRYSNVLIFIFNYLKFILWCIFIPLPDSTQRKPCKRYSVFKECVNFHISRKWMPRYCMLRHLICSWRDVHGRG